MAFIPAMQLSELKEQVRATKVIADHKVLLIWHNDNVHALQAQCPHLKLPLTKGKIDADNTITCPFHKSKFCLQTGAVKCWSAWPPVIGSLLGKVSKQKDLPIYATQITDDGMITVDISH